MPEEDNLNTKFSIDKPEPIDLGGLGSNNSSEDTNTPHTEEDNSGNIGIFDDNEKHDFQITTDDNENSGEKHKFLDYLKNWKILSGVVAILALTIVAGVWLSRNNNSLKTTLILNGVYPRKGEFKLELANPEEKLEVGKEFAVNILMNSNNEPVINLDVRADYDGSFLEATNDQGTGQPFAQGETFLFPMTGSNEANDDKGLILLSMYLNQNTTAPIKTNDFEKIATYYFTPKKEGSTSIKLEFKGFTSDNKHYDDDSGIKIPLDLIDKAQYCPNDPPPCQYDILNNVTNLDLNIGGDVPQTDPLEIQILEPEDGKEIDENSSVKFEGAASGGTPPYDIEWDFDNSGISNENKLAPGKLTFKKAGKFTISFTVTDANGTSKTEKVKIRVNKKDNHEDDNSDDNQAPKDSDNDGIPDIEEIVAGEDGYITDPYKADTDADGFSDLEEINSVYDPTYSNAKSPFIDVPTNHNFYKYIIKLYNKGVVNGYDTTHYGPNGKTSRFELIKLVMRSMDIKAETASASIFSDVPRGHEAYDYVNTAYSLGIVNGVGDKFYPWKEVTREEAVKIIIGALSKQGKVTLSTDRNSGFNDVDPADGFSTYIKTATDLGIVSGYTKTEFRPFRNITRGEVAKIIANAMDVK